MNRQVKFAGIGLLLAGLLLLFDTLFGLIAMLGIGFDSFQDVLLVLCLTMGFPLFLTGLYALRVSAILLWVFFIAQWIDTSSNGVSFTLLNPFDWWYGDFAFAAALLMSLSYIALRRSGYEKHVSFMSAFDPPSKARV
jgi:hypothetical protein